MNTAAAWPADVGPEAAWSRARAAHAESVRGFLAAEARLGPARWAEPIGPGKWTVGQIAEHLRIAYVEVLAELREGRTMRLKFSRLMRFVLRHTVLRKLLGGEFPRGAIAPREVRPGATPADREGTLAALAALTAEFEEELGARRHRADCRVTHPYFGSVDPARAIRFLEIHNRHHTSQLAALVPPAS